MSAMRQAGCARRASTRVRALASGAVLLAALGVAAPAAAAAPGDARLLDLLRLRADRADAGAGAHAAGPAVWPARAGSADRAAAARAEAAVARRTSPARVTVGLRTAGSLAAVARDLRARGLHVARTDRVLALLEIDARRPARLAAAIADDPRVAFVELARARRLSGGGEGPFAGADPLTGRAYGWAFDRINAEPAIAAAGGGSPYPVAVVDSGVDLDHPDLAANVRSAFDTVAGEARPPDLVGHGTFVAGLASAVSGNGLGLRGAAGATPLLAVRAGTGDLVASADIAEGIRWAVANRARVINLSLGGDGLSLAEERALDLAFIRDVLPVAAAGNTADDGNPVQYPAAYVGGWRGGFGIGLSVAATDPDGRHAIFSTHNPNVSLAAPGAGGPGCDDGVFSTVPTRPTTIFDGAPACGARVVGALGDPGGRYGYLSGTSMAAPLAAGAAALVWENNRRLASEQVAHLLMRSARQTRGTGWNAYTGAGVVDAAAAWRLARRYDTLDPRATLSLRRRATRAWVRLSGRDRTLRGDELAGRIRFSLFSSRDGRDFRRVAGPSRRALARSFALSRRPLWIQGMACDRNLNCTVIEHGPLRRR